MGCHAKVIEFSLSCCLSIVGRRIVSFIPLLWEMKTASSRIWTPVTVFVFYNGNHYITSDYHYLFFLFHFQDLSLILSAVPSNCFLLLSFRTSSSIIMIVFWILQLTITHICSFLNLFWYSAYSSHLALLLICPISLILVLLEWVRGLTCC